jgi:hypothetical protein
VCQDNNIVTRHPSNINCIAIRKNNQVMKAWSKRHKSLRFPLDK